MAKSKKKVAKPPKPRKQLTREKEERLAFHLATFLFIPPSGSGGLSDQQNGMIQKLLMELDGNTKARLRDMIIKDLRARTMEQIGQLRQALDTLEV